MRQEETKNNAGSHDLYVLKDGQYMVKSFKLSKPYVLPTIEGAAEVLEMIGVLDDEIDFTLITMRQNSHNHAQFGIRGYLTFTDYTEVAGY